MGNLTNASVIAICMAIFGQTGPINTTVNGVKYTFSWNGTTNVLKYNGTMTVSGSKNVLCLSYGFGAIACIVMVAYRFTFLEESEVSLPALVPCPRGSESLTYFTIIWPDRRCLWRNRRLNRP